MLLYSEMEQNQNSQGSNSNIVFNNNKEISKSQSASNQQSVEHASQQPQRRFDVVIGDAGTNNGNMNSSSEQLHLQQDAATVEDSNQPFIIAQKSQNQNQQQQQQFSHHVHEEDEDDDVAFGVKFASNVNTNNNKNNSDASHNNDTYSFTIPEGGFFPLKHDQIQESIEMLVPGQTVTAIWRDHPKALADEAAEREKNGTPAPKPGDFMGVKDWALWRGVVASRQVMTVENNNNNNNNNGNHGGEENVGDDQDDDDDEATQQRFLENESKNKRVILSIHWWMDNPHIHHVAKDSYKYTLKQKDSNTVRRYVIFDFPIEEEHVQYAQITGGEMIPNFFKKSKKASHHDGKNNNNHNGEGQEGEDKNNARSNLKKMIGEKKQKKSGKKLSKANAASGARKESGMFDEDDNGDGIERSHKHHSDDRVLLIPDFSTIEREENQHNVTNNNSNNHGKKSHKKKVTSIHEDEDETDDAKIDRLNDMDDVASHVADAVRLMAEGKLEVLAKWFQRASDISAEQFSHQQDIRRRARKLEKRLERQAREEEEQLRAALGVNEDEDEQEATAVDVEGQEKREEELSSAIPRDAEDAAAADVNHDDDDNLNMNENPLDEITSKNSTNKIKKPVSFVEVGRPSFVEIAAAVFDRNEDTVPFLDVGEVQSFLEGKTASYQHVAEKYLVKPGETEEAQQRMVKELRERAAELLFRQQQQQQQHRAHRKRKEGEHQAMTISAITVASILASENFNNNNNDNNGEVNGNQIGDDGMMKMMTAPPRHEDETSQHSHTSSAAAAAAALTLAATATTTTDNNAAKKDGKKPKPKTAVSQTPSIMSFFGGGAGIKNSNNNNNNNNATASTRPSGNLTAQRQNYETATTCEENHNTDDATTTATNNNNNAQASSDQTSSIYTATVAVPTSTGCAIFKHGFLTTGRHMPERLRKLLAGQPSTGSTLSNNNNNNNEPAPSIESSTVALVDKIKQNTPVTSEYIGRELCQDFVCVGYVSENYEKVYHRPHFFGTFNRRRVQDGACISRKEVIRRFACPLESNVSSNRYNNSNNNQVTKISTVITTPGQAVFVSDPVKSLQADLASKHFHLLSHAIALEQKRFEPTLMKVLNPTTNQREQKEVDEYEYDNDSGDEWEDGNNDDGAENLDQDEVASQDESDDDTDMSNFLEEDALAQREKNLSELVPEACGPFINFGTPSLSHAYRDVDSLYLESKVMKIKGDAVKLSATILNNDSTLKMLTLLGLSIPKPPAPSPTFVVLGNAPSNNNKNSNIDKTNNTNNQSLQQDSSSSPHCATASSGDHRNGNDDDDVMRKMAMVQQENGNDNVQMDDAGNISSSSPDHQSQQQQQQQKPVAQKRNVVRFGTEQELRIEEFVRANTRLSKTHMIEMLYDHLNLTTEKEASLASIASKVTAKFSFSKATNSWETKVVKPKAPRAAKATNTQQDNLLLLNPDGSPASKNNNNNDDEDEDDVPFGAQFAASIAANNGSNNDDNNNNNDENNNVQNNHQDQAENPGSQEQQMI